MLACWVYLNQEADVVLLKRGCKIPFIRCLREIGVFEVGHDGSAHRVPIHTRKHRTGDMLTFVIRGQRVVAKVQGVSGDPR